MSRPALSEPDPPAGAQPLISVAGLAAALGPGGPVLLDVRWRLGGPPGLGSYRAGHLPGAVFVDLDAELAGPPGSRGRHPMPPPGVFQAAMRAAGVCDGRPVVVYDDADATTAARAWWLLRYFGHADARVLDGGLAAWAAAGHPVSTDEPAPRPGDFTARPGQLAVVDSAGAGELARSGTLLDARAPARYRGEIEPADPVAGHIPGALSAPTGENVRRDGQFRPAGELRTRFENLGAAGGGPVGVYCGSGVTAAHEVLALQLAGIPAALYVGSWSEWIADPARPVATGPRPGSLPAVASVRPLVLASASPARLALLRGAGIDPVVVPSGADESAAPGQPVAQVVAMLARRKAEAVAASRPGDLVLGCDSLLELDGEPAGKPGSAEAASALWRRLAGRQAVLHTGHHLIDGAAGRQASGVAATTVRFGRPAPAELAAYIATGEPLGLAGAFSIDGRAGAFVEGIDGDPGNVIGVSLPLLRRLLAELGIAITDLWRPPAGRVLR